MSRRSFFGRGNASGVGLGTFRTGTLHWHLTSQGHAVSGLFPNSNHPPIYSRVRDSNAGVEVFSVREI